MYDSFVFLYPHTAYFESMEKHLVANRGDIDPQKVHQYFRRQVVKARSSANRTVLITINQENGQPNGLSRFVSPSDEDIILPVDVVGTGMDAPTRNADYQIVAQQILGQQLLLGGFHYSDCLVQLALYLFDQDHSVDIAMLTTDFLYDLLSIPGKNFRQIGQLSHPIGLPQWLSHFKDHLRRTWAAELEEPPLA